MTQSIPTLHFYFDYISGYAYFAWLQLQTFCHKYRVPLKVHPTVFGVLLDHWGQLGPAEIPSKKTFVYRQGYRYAARHGFQFNPPKEHPFNPLPALRVSLEEVGGNAQARVITTIFQAGWSQGRDIGNPDELVEILNAAGLDGVALMARTQDLKVKALLKTETDQAIEKGVFGVPTMLVDEQLFWGSDQFDDLALYYQGKDPLDEAAVQEMLKRPRGMDRKKIKQ